MRYVSEVAKDYLQKRIHTANRPFRDSWISIALRAYENRYGHERVWRHRVRLEDALAAVYAQAYQQANPEAV